MKSIYNNFENKFITLKDLQLRELPPGLVLKNDKFTQLDGVDPPA